MDNLSEQVDVVERCARCGMATVWCVWTQYDDGVVTGQRRVLAHTDENCSRFAALREEEWPALAVLRRPARG